MSKPEESHRNLETPYNENVHAVRLYLIALIFSTILCSCSVVCVEYLLAPQLGSQNYSTVEYALFPSDEYYHSFLIKLNDV